MTKLESGRSMVEMLGVLAIIGVLSIGGIAGYTMAMNRYKANELLSAASMLNVVALSQNQGNGVETGSYSTLVAAAPAQIAGVNVTDITVTGRNTVQVNTGEDAICDAMVNIAGGERVSCNGATATIDFEAGAGAATGS